MTAMHIAFGDSAAGNVKAALKIYGQHALENNQPVNTLLENAALLPCSDRFSIGPVFEMDLPMGFYERISWIGNFLEETLEPEMSLDDVDDMLERISDFYKKLAWIENNHNVVLWHSPNVTEQIGIRLVSALLPNCQLFEVPFNLSEKHIEKLAVKPTCIGECPTEILTELCNYIQPVEQAKRDLWLTEWQTLMQTEGLLRIWNGTDVQTVSEEYFDAALIEKCNEQFQSALRIVGEVLAEGVCEACCDYLTLRLRQLIKTGVLKVEGDLTSIRTYKIAK